MAGPKLPSSVGPPIAPTTARTGGRKWSLADDAPAFAWEAPRMASVPRGGVVAVTGAAGFVGGHVVQRLLDCGYRVRACVRNVDDDTRVGFLKAMNPYASGRLTLHAADLDDPGCFDDIFRDCDGVAHVSHVST